VKPTDLLLALLDKARVGDEFDQAFEELVRLGYLEVSGVNEKGECQYRLTPKALSK